MKKKIVKVLEFVMVILGIIAGVFVAKNISVESMLRKKEEPVTLAMTEDGLQEDFIGLPAADDITRVESQEDWDDTWAVSCITVEPLEVIPTGIGVRHPWISAYSRSRRGGTRKRPEVSRMVFDILDEYAEYYLIQLPDQSYILAQMPTDVARKLKAGKQITLPVGKKGGVHQQALANIKDLCEEYDVNTEGIFYCINDTWNEGHYLMVQIIKLGIAFLVMLVVGTILITIVNKVLKVKD